MNDCLFCRIVAGELPTEFVDADDAAVAFLDIAPLQPGHTLIVSRRHVPNALADPVVLADLAPMISRVGRRLIDRLDADGLNVLTNVGEASGQSVFHLHVHLIPRFADRPGIEGMLQRPEGIDNAAVLARVRGE